MTDFNSLFKKVCTNAYHAERYRFDKETKTVLREPQQYLNNDLSHWSEEAFQRGDLFFYCERVNPDNPWKLRLCEPKYEYQLKRPLTEEEYAELTKIFEMYAEKQKK